MSEIILITIAAGVMISIIGILAALMFMKKRKEINKVETDYRVFFIIGLFMTIIGIIGIIASFLAEFSFFIGLPFFSIGIVYIGIGLGNRDKWRIKK
jgi:hypothetical protein